MLKSVLVSLCLIGSAHALTPLAQAPTPVASPHYSTCSGANFTPNGERVTGACIWSYGPSCGRYCQSAQVAYAVSWSLRGVPKRGVQCGSAPAGRFPAWTYARGYNSTTCAAALWSAASVDVGGTYYYLHAVSVYGREVVCSNVVCFID